MIRAATLAAAILLWAGAAAAQERSFQVSNATPNCRDGSRATHQVCLPEGQRVRIPAQVTTKSSGGSRAVIESQGPAPDRPNCWQIVTYVEPKGEDCVKLYVANPVCTCKGRGFIELEVRLTPQ